MANLGLGVHRLGLEWARLEPRPGVFDADALAHYRAELSALRERGIEPLVTLHHFTNPSWFEAAGGWMDPQSPAVFDRFVRYAVTHLSDLVPAWCTINEPNVYASFGWLYGTFPPARRNSWRALRIVLRHLAIARCTAYRTITSLDTAAPVGFAHHVRVFEPLRAGNPMHRGLAALSARLFQDIIGEAMLAGRFAKELGGQPKEVTPGRYYDYLGINYYSRTAVSRLDDGTFPDAAVNDLGWEIHPQGLVTLARELTQRFPGPIWVTENGTADNTESFRSRYIHDHLRAIVTSGLPPPHRPHDFGMIPDPGRNPERFPWFRHGSGVSRTQEPSSPGTGQPGAPASPGHRPARGTGQPGHCRAAWTRSRHAGAMRAPSGRPTT